MTGKSSPSLPVSVTSFTEPKSNKTGEPQSPTGSQDSLSASPDLSIKYTDLPVFLKRELDLLSEQRKGRQRGQLASSSSSSVGKASFKSPGVGSTFSSKVGSGGSGKSILPDLAKAAPNVSKQAWDTSKVKQAK